MKVMSKKQEELMDKKMKAACSRTKDNLRKIYLFLSIKKASAEVFLILKYGVIKR